MRSFEFSLGATFRQKHTDGTETEHNASEGGMRWSRYGSRRPVPTPAAAQELADFAAEAKERARQSRAPEGWRPW